MLNSQQMLCFTILSFKILQTIAFETLLFGPIFFPHFPKLEGREIFDFIFYFDETIKRVTKNKAKTMAIGMGVSRSTEKMVVPTVDRQTKSRPPLPVLPYVDICFSLNRDL